MDDFSPRYREVIEASLTTFVQKGDDVVCVGYYARHGGVCEMCGHHPITWHFIVENLRTYQPLVVGSECVGNWQTILAERGWVPDYIVFPERLRAYTHWILKDHPNAIVFNDNVVMRSQVDCQPIIAEGLKAGGMQHFGYVYPSVRGGRNCLEMVREDVAGVAPAKPAEDAGEGIPF